MIGWSLGLLALAFTLFGGAELNRRRRRPTLQGQLIPVRGPADATLPLTRDLGLERVRTLYLGSRGRDEWKLNGWPANVKLALDSKQRTTLYPGREVESPALLVTVNGAILRYPRVLADGDLIACGDYAIRYENLLY